MISWVREAVARQYSRLQRTTTLAEPYKAASGTGLGSHAPSTNEQLGATSRLDMRGVVAVLVGQIKRNEHYFSNT